MTNSSEGVGREGVGRDAMLSVRDLRVYYGAAAALRGISFDVYEGEVVTIDNNKLR